MGEKSIQVKDFIRVFLGVCLLLVNVLAGLIGLSVLGVTSWLYIIQERFPFYFEERSEYIMIMLLVCGALLFVFSLQGILGGVLSLFIHPRSQSIARLVLILYSFALLLLYSAVIVAISLQWDSFYFSRVSIYCLKCVHFVFLHYLFFLFLVLFSSSLSGLSPTELWPAGLRNGIRIYQLHPKQQCLLRIQQWR